MLSTDRTEFESQLAKMCAGFNVPLGERVEAYWTGLAKMSLLQFVRCVDYALGESGPDKIPTTGQLWKIHNIARNTSTQITQPARHVEDKDHLLYFANRLLMAVMRGRSMGSTGVFRQGVGMTECQPTELLLSSRKVVRELVEYFTPAVLEHDCDATPHAFVTMFVKSMKRVHEIDARTLKDFRTLLTKSGMRNPFPAYMARSLMPVSQPQLFQGMTHAQT